MSYRQLTPEERYQIQVMLRAHLSYADIARELGRHRSTISREVKRNSASRNVEDVKVTKSGQLRIEHTRVTLAYQARNAIYWARQRRVAKGAACRKLQGGLKDLVEQKLKMGWSPEQICGRLRHELGTVLSHETIYQHVLRDAKQRGILRYCLRYSGYKHHRFKKSKAAERARERKNRIEDRPRAANERTELGHWERDSLLGARGRGAFLTLVDRRSRYVLLRRVNHLDSDVVGAATLEALKPFRAVTKTITNDNGVEFQRDQSLQNELGVPIYFTNPASPWERGSVENANGLIRQYVKKGENIEKLPDWTTIALEQTLNNRPRKTLDYRTPHEAFFDENVRLFAPSLMRFGLEFGRCL